MNENKSNIETIGCLDKYKFLLGKKVISKSSWYHAAYGTIAAIFNFQDFIKQYEHTGDAYRKGLIAKYPNCEQFPIVSILLQKKELAKMNGVDNEVAAIFAPLEDLEIVETTNIFEYISFHEKARTELTW